MLFCKGVEILMLSIGVKWRVSEVEIAHVGFAQELERAAKKAGSKPQNCLNIAAKIGTNNSLLALP